MFSGYTRAQWCGGAAVTGGVLGALSLAIGAVAVPISFNGANPSAEAILLFVRGMLVLVALGAAVSAAYFVGGAMIDASGRLPWVPAAWEKRSGAVCGAVTLACFWVTSTLFLIVTNMYGENGSPLNVIGSRLFFAVICVLLGAGTGGLGERTRQGRAAVRVRPAATSTATDLPAGGASTDEARDSNDVSSLA